MVFSVKPETSWTHTANLLALNWTRTAPIYIYIYIYTYIYKTKTYTASSSGTGSELKWLYCWSFFITLFSLYHLFIFLSSSEAAEVRSFQPALPPFLFLGTSLSFVQHCHLESRICCIISTGSLCCLCLWCLCSYEQQIINGLITCTVFASAFMKGFSSVKRLCHTFSNNIQPLITFLFPVPPWGEPRPMYLNASSR